MCSLVWRQCSQLEAVDGIVTLMMGGEQAFRFVTVFHEPGDAAAFNFRTIYNIQEQEA